MIYYALILLVGASFVLGDEPKGGLCFPTGYCRSKSSTDKRLIQSMIREIMVPPPPVAGGLEVVDAYLKSNDTGKVYIALFGFQGDDDSYKRCIMKFAVKPDGKDHEVIHKPKCSNKFKDLYSSLVEMLIEDETFGIAAVGSLVEAMLILIRKWISI